MDPELRLLHLLRKHWLALAVVMGVAWAIECHLEGNSAFETVAAPLLAATWLGVIFLLDRWALRHTRGGSLNEPRSHSFLPPTRPTNVG
jgi:hypothetical protein